ncbi:glycosyltransferase family 4 protein [Roseobacteraceae bacterium S113]
MPGTRVVTRLLDITRMIRRAGRPMTGIDRVEFAYLRELVDHVDPLFAIARTRLGYVLLDHDGAREMTRRLSSGAFGPLDALGRLAPHRSEAVRRAEADLRRLSRARCLPQRLAAMLRGNVPKAVRYINVGHSNFTDRMISALNAHEAQIAVLVHDVIPLEAPDWQRTGSVDAFRRFLYRVDQHADIVIYNSHDTQSRTETHLTRVPRGVVAHLGVEPFVPDARDADLPDAPYFVSVGTIEPRKNHALLLDLWDEMGADAPNLVIAGHRGWKNEDVFARLDAGHPRVTEAPGLTDGALAHLVAGAQALLFPSHLEGFGLPPVEAAALGVPVVCQPLPVLREVMGDIPIYVAASDAYRWRHEIEKLAEQGRTPEDFVPPTWTDHFNTVLMLT